MRHGEKVILGLEVPIVAPESKQWVKGNQRGRTRGFYLYIDGYTLDGALIDAGYDPEDLPHISRIRFRRSWSMNRIFLNIKVLPEEAVQHD